MAYRLPVPETAADSGQVHLNEEESNAFSYACPFLVHQPDRYERVKGACITKKCGIKRLKEHVYRCHWGCRRCQKKFCKGHKDAQGDHGEGICDEKDEDYSRPELMTDVQRKDLDDLDLRTLGRAREEKWRLLYQTLFPSHHEPKSISFPDTPNDQPISSITLPVDLFSVPPSPTRFTLSDTTGALSNGSYEPFLALNSIDVIQFGSASSGRAYHHPQPQGLVVLSSNSNPTNSGYKIITYEEPGKYSGTEYTGMEYLGME